MRENRMYGSEGGEPGNRASLPLSFARLDRASLLRYPGLTITMGFWRLDRREVPRGRILKKKLYLLALFLLPTLVFFSLSRFWQELEPPTSVQLEITVIDEATGAPIPGVKVAILDWATRTEQKSEETNLQGRVLLQLGPGQYWLTADHADYLSGETGVSLDPAKARLDKTLILRGVSRVTGTLKNQNGAAVADVL